MPLSPISTLKELGITGNESAEAQFLAKLKRVGAHEAVRTGQMRVAQARLALKTEEIRQKLEEVAAQAPDGKFDAIVIDPPWQAMEEGKLGYSTMSLAQIEQENLVGKYAAENCHVFLWTTQRFLPDAFDILKKWGVEYRFTIVWHKDGGQKPTGYPQYTCEFCLYGRVGSPVFVETRDFQTCFNADRTRHSEKPEKFYEILRRVTAGRRIDCYNRRKIEGFIGWGNEAVV